MSTVEEGDLNNMKNLLSYIKENDLKDLIISRSDDPSMKEANQNFVDTKFEGHALLTKACQKGHIDICEYLVREEKANVDVRGEGEEIIGKRSNWTPLMHATFHNHPKIVKFLVSKNCNIVLKDDHGDDSTHIAATKGSVPILEILLEKNPSLLDRKGCYGETQLIRAASVNNFNVCDYLIKNKIVNVNAKDSGQTSALWHVCANNNYELAKLLIESGATNEKSKFYGTPLEKALNGNNQNLKDLMQSNLASKNLQQDYGCDNE